MLIDKIYKCETHLQVQEWNRECGIIYVCIHKVINLRNKKTPEEMREMYKDNTTVANVYEIGGVKYTVVSHYVGEKDIDDVILKLAESSAYADRGYFLPQTTRSRNLVFPIRASLITFGQIR